MLKPSHGSSLTGCPGCGQLCVGPSILPCGHLLCRKCLLSLLDGGQSCLHCPTCHQKADTADMTSSDFTQVTKHFPIDTVIHRLVIQQLMENMGSRCSVPHAPSTSPFPNPPSSAPPSLDSSHPPSYICLECDDVFCANCAHVHRSSYVSEHHALMSVEPPELPPDEPPELTPVGDSASHDVQDSAKMNSKNLEEFMQAVSREAELFQETMSTCEVVVNDLTDLLTQRQHRQRVLEAYCQHLSSRNVRLNDIFLQRFRHVREECVSACQKDMDNLHQMQSRKIPQQKVDTQVVAKEDLPANPVPECLQLQEISKKWRTWWQGLHRQLTSDDLTVRLTVTALLALLLGMLLLLLLPSSSVPYTADRVVLQPLEAESFSLTGAPCQNHGCSRQYFDFANDILVTPDNRVVIALKNRKAIYVQSASEETQVVKLNCEPTSLAQLPNGTIAVTCPHSLSVVLVSLESNDSHIQYISTKESYFEVAAHPVDELLIVGTLDETSVDFINLQGDVVQMLQNPVQRNGHHIKSLTVTHDNLLVTQYKNGLVLWIHLLDPNFPVVDTVRRGFISNPVDTAVDKAGNLFLALRTGEVMIRSPKGHTHSLPIAGDEGKKIQLKLECLALHEDRLLVVTVKLQDSSSVVTEYRLVDP